MTRCRLPTRLLASVALTGLLAFSSAGCTTNSTGSGQGLLASRSPSAPEASRADGDLRGSAHADAERYRNNPRDPDAAIRYAQSLRQNGQRAQASAVLQQASIQNTNNKKLLGAYGRALADAGNFAQALEVLNRAHTPEQPDWRILSAQGAVLDQMGRYEEARRYYNAALKIVPDEPSVMSNLGLSYALSKQLPQAETTLRKASERAEGDRRIRQNLALVVGLRGRFKEAQDTASADLAPEEAAENMAYLKSMLARSERGKPGRPPVQQLAQEDAS